METDRKYVWESYAEYVALGQFQRCLGAVLASAPRRLSRRVAPGLLKATVMTSIMFTLAHSEDAEGEVLPPDSRVEAQAAALRFAAVLRDGLTELKGRVSAPHLSAALELLERFEEGTRARPLPPSPNIIWR